MGPESLRILIISKFDLVGRIFVFFLVDQLKVKMRSGTLTGISNLTGHLTGFHILTFLNINFIEMRV